MTSHGGRDFAALGGALAAQGYRFGALEIDAAAFVPQSRPRIFVIATQRPPPAGLTGASPFHTRAVRAAAASVCRRTSRETLDLVAAGRGRRAATPT